MPLPPREHLARRIANELLDSHGVSQVPVDPTWLAVQEGATVIEQSGFPTGCYGALCLVDGAFQILVSTECPTAGHKRFTIAHEVAHFIIDGHVDGLAWTGDFALSQGHFRGRRDPIEVEADCFAAELLMPTRWARDVVEQREPGLGAVRELADRFDTSMSASAIRYAALSPEPVVVVLSHGLQIEWVASSGHFDAAAWMRFRRHKGEWAPRGSATRYLGGRRDDVATAEEATGSGLLCEWFEGAPAQLEVQEEVVGLGPFGRTLTVLSCPDLDPDVLDEEGDADDEPRDWRDALRGYR